MVTKIETLYQALQENDFKLAVNTFYQLHEKVRRYYNSLEHLASIYPGFRWEYTWNDNAFLDYMKEHPFSPSFEIDIRHYYREHPPEYTYDKMLRDDPSILAILYIGLELNGGRLVKEWERKNTNEMIPVRLDFESIPQKAESMKKYITEIRGSLT